MDRIFTEDIVALKAKPSLRATVISTWRDSESYIRSITKGVDLLNHTDVSHAVAKQTLEKGRPPEGYVFIAFIKQEFGKAIVAESSLVLLDRSHAVGDAVKKSLSAVDSGTVTKVRTQCRIQPIYRDLPYQGHEPWPHKQEDNELWVPSEEVYEDGFQPGDYVSYQGWVGEVVDVLEEVTVCQENGNVVRVRDATELEAPLWINEPVTATTLPRAFKSLSEALEPIDTQVWTSSRESVMLPIPEGPRVTDKVYTKKSHLRLGHWIVGSYNASQPAGGVVVETRVVELEVQWLANDIFSREMAAQPQPTAFLTSHHIDNLKMFTLHLPDSPYGSRMTHEIMVGDYVRFRNEPEAALKYAENSEHGYFRRIPRTMTQGYNMNVFDVVETRSEMEVEWQNGTKTWHPAADLVPYLHVDEHDVWPGDYVSMNEQIENSSGFVRAGSIGVVQTVDARERVANVRWFTNPNIQCFAHDELTLVPESKCGELSQEISSVSLYDIGVYPALDRGRGDIVIIRPNEVDKTTPTSDSSGALLGEVVNKKLDGKVTVRMGVLDPPRETVVNADELLLIVSPEDGGSTDDESLDDYMDDGNLNQEGDYSDDEMYDGDDRSVEAIEETIIYEGGTRLDDGEEDAWMTDSTEEEELDDDAEAVENAPKHNQEDDEAAAAADENTIAADNDSRGHEEQAASVNAKNDSGEAESRTEYQFNEYEGMPPQFEILDQPPPENHKFFSHNHSWNKHGMLKRIRKEHKLLQTSLPRGIWVRTWADRLDLLRILIIGPQGTPYALAPFVLDFAFGNGYPSGPPEGHFHSWTNSVGRINPNLYEDGKICLSVLGTWPESQKNEAWDSDRSSMLQILVSLLGLVLVERPYYNEAGFEDMQGNDEALVNEQIYSEKALVMAKGFVVHALENDIQGVGDIINWVYKNPEGPKMLQWVVKEAQKLRSQDADEAGKKKISRGALMLLERYLPTLERMLD